MVSAACGLVLAGHPVEPGTVVVVVSSAGVGVEVEDVLDPVDDVVDPDDAVVDVVPEPESRPPPSSPLQPADSTATSRITTTGERRRMSRRVRPWTRRGASLS